MKLERFFYEYYFFEKDINELESSKIISKILYDLLTLSILHTLRRLDNL